MARKVEVVEVPVAMDPVAIEEVEVIEVPTALAYLRERFARDNVAMLHDAIDRLIAVSDRDKAELHEILNVEGFGGSEDEAITPEAALEVAEEKLLWLWQMREDGLR